MTDNPQRWQPGQPPPRPSSDPQEPQPYGGPSSDRQPQPYGGPSDPQQPQPYGGPSDPQQPQPYGERSDPPPAGAWQGQGQQGGWQGQPMPSGQPQGPRLAEGDERTWMLLAHLSAPLAAILSLGWLSFVGPLVVWMMRKEDSQAVRTASAGAFNFNLSFWLMNIIAWICLFTVILIPVAIIIWVIVWPVAIYAHLRGAWLASKGKVYTYPFQIRVLS